MNNNKRINFSEEDCSSDRGQNTGDKSRTKFNLPSSSASGCVRGLYFNSSHENKSAVKRKIEDNAGLLDEKKKKDIPSSSFCDSPWEFRRLRADLIEAQALIVRLEDRIDELHEKNKETVIFFDKEKNEIKLQLESNRNAAKDLEYRLHKVRKRESECREELNETLKLHELEKKKFSEKILLVEKEKREMKLEFEELKSNSETSQMKLQDEIRNLKEENERLKLDVEEKKELYNNLEERLSAAVKQSNNAEEIRQELKIVQLKLKELENEKAEFEESRKLTVILSEKLLHLPEIEKELIAKRQEVINLRQSIQNKIVLEELIHDYKLKLSSAEERDKQIPVLKARITELEIELKKWTSLAADFSSESSIDSLKNYIESLQDKELSVSLQINNSNASLKTAENKLSTLQHEMENMKELNEKLENSLQKLKVEVQVLRKKSILITRERDSYRQQLDLYEKDLTMTGLNIENLSNEMCTQMKERIKTLEDSLEEYRRHVELLENQIKEYQGEDQNDNFAVICKLKDEIKELVESNKVLSQIRDELENKLEARVLKGEYLSPNIKVLHFRENPITQAQKKQFDEISNLRQECDRLKARVKLLESGEIMDVTQKVSESLESFSSEKVRELEKELESANLKMQRLKEVYRKTSQEFCDVSYMLLGYRIVLVSNNKLYKLFNMYSTSPSDYLMFQQTKTGAMEMLGTPFAESLSKLVDEHLHKRNSIPAFLAAVTLSLHSSIEHSEDDDDNGNEKLPEEIKLD